MSSQWRKGLRDSLFALGTQSPGAYFHAHTAAYNVLLFGAKKWMLLPPAADYGPVHGKMVDWTTGSRRHEAAPLECTQLGGEVLVVPEGWGHGVINLADSIGAAVELGWNSAGWVSGAF